MILTKSVLFKDLVAGEHDMIKEPKRHRKNEMKIKHDKA